MPKLIHKTHMREKERKSACDLVQLEVLGGDGSQFHGGDGEMANSSNYAASDKGIALSEFPLILSELLSESLNSL
ncbi:hypothetical protein VNO78_10716 [Psophocarpus tetragonolobus]|uniref:Uncharacterized protein n=1 Tax=Psophocarpus tetragonolobus TaxID=3891 RepID=A0AAN9SMW6_PSOTE